MRVAIVDTTEEGSRGSMTRYRLQLERALSEFASERLSFQSIYLGRAAKPERVPAKLRTYARHFRCWRDARKFDARDFDVVHLLDGSFGYVASAIRSRHQLVTVHDVIPRLQIEGHFPSAPAVSRPSRWLIGRALRGVSGAKRVCSVSQSTKDDLVRLGCRSESNVTVVPMAIEKQLFCTEPSQNTNEAVPQEPYLFHVGNNGFYKNRVGVVEVFRRMKTSEDLKLVMAGPPPGKELIERVRRYGLENRVSFKNDPDQSTLGALYSRSAIFVFPSLYEGFGWPPLEAMSVGCPVVCSDAGSIAEVVGDAALVETSEDYEAMARSCERLLSDADLRNRMIARGHARVEQHSLERLAMRMVALYEETAAA